MTATIHNLRDYELKRVHIDAPVDAPLRSQAGAEDASDYREAVRALNEMRDADLWPVNFKLAKLLREPDPFAHPREPKVGA